MTLSSGWFEPISLRSSRASQLLKFFKPLRLHLQLADLLEQFLLLGLALGFGFRLLSTREELAGTLKQLLLPLARLNRSHREVRRIEQIHAVISGDLLDRLAATNRRHGDLGLELGAVGATLAHWWKPLSGAVPHLRG